MSALGQKQTFAVHKRMSALPPTADMCGATRHVRFVPIADIASVDHHVGASEQSRRHSEAEHLCCFKVDRKFEL